MIRRLHSTVALADRLYQEYAGATDGWLPSRAELAQRLGCSTGAIRCAAEVLRDDGRIKTTGIGFKAVTTVVATGLELHVKIDVVAMCGSGRQGCDDKSESLKLRQQCRELDRLTESLAVRYQDDPRASRPEPRWKHQADSFTGYRVASC